MQRFSSSSLPDCSCLQTVRNGCCFVNVFSEHCCSQAICSVICPFNDLINITKLDYLLHWAKYLFNRKENNYYYL